MVERCGDWVEGDVGDRELMGSFGRSWVEGVGWEWGIPGLAFCGIRRLVAKLIMS